MSNIPGVLALVPEEVEDSPQFLNDTTGGASANIGGVDSADITDATLNGSGSIGDSASGVLNYVSNTFDPSELPVNLKNSNVSENNEELLERVLESGISEESYIAIILLLALKRGYNFLKSLIKKKMI
jgi:hypothetical protein